VGFYEGIVSDNVVNFSVQGQSPLEAAAPLFSNFLAVSRLGTEIQFEFVFLDLNQMAVALEQFKAEGVTVSPVVQGKTVSKVVMPASAFAQLRGQLEKIFDAIEQLVPRATEERDDRRNSNSALAG
jgi:hypothetical protein